VLTKDQSDPSPILSDFSVATELDPDWYQAWHTWALANFEAITQLEVSQQGLISAHFTTYIIPAVEGMSISMLAADDTGFLRSIALSPGNSLQDTLRLLTLWFTYGYQAGVSAAISQGIHTVSIDVWLEVIPQVRCLSLPISGRTAQIIARVQTPRAIIQQLIVRLLNDIGKAHPQALIYPLTVAAKSNVASRKAVAENIMTKMREHSATIVDQVDWVLTYRRPLLIGI